MTAADRMLNATIPHVQRVRRRLSDGTTHIHFYHRPTKIRLPLPTDPGFTAAYEAAERRLETQQTKASEPANSQVPPNNDASKSFVEHPPEIEPKPILEEAEAVQYLTPEEVSLRWRRKVDVDTLKNWRSLRVGPPFHRFGRAVLYRADLLECWESKNLTVTDRDAGSA